MRRILILSLAVLVWTADLLAAQETSRSSEIDPWCQKHIVEAYEKVGSRDPAWDDDARDILAAMARMWSRYMTRTRDEEDLIWFAGERIMQAGCDDPLVRYQYARNLDYWNVPVQELVEAHRQAADLMRESDYHPLIKFHALARAAEVQSRMKELPGAPAPEQAIKLFDEAIALLPQIAADQQVPRRRFSEILRVLHDAGKSMDGDIAPAMQTGLEIFEAHCPNRSTNLALRAQFLLKHAWQARGTESFYAEEGWRHMPQRLELAAQAAEEAWKLDPTNHLAAEIMMSIELGQGQSADRLKKWFGRAAETDPTSFEPYSKALYYLEPRWHGNPAALLRFGRLAMTMGNWDAAGPYALVKAHLARAIYEHPQKGAARKYFLRNKEAWQDIQSFYTEYLRRVPESLYYRTEYAKLAAWCGQWEEADRQFQVMGDRFSYKAMGTEEQYRALREEIRSHLKPPTATPAAGPN